MARSYYRDGEFVKIDMDKRYDDAFFAGELIAQVLQKAYAAHHFTLSSSTWASHATAMLHRFYPWTTTGSPVQFPNLGQGDEWLNVVDLYPSVN
jgi:hypothetical protein